MDFSAFTLPPEETTPTTSIPTPSKKNIIVIIAIVVVVVIVAICLILWFLLKRDKSPFTIINVCRTGRLGWARLETSAYSIAEDYNLPIENVIVVCNFIATEEIGQEDRSSGWSAYSTGHSSFGIDFYNPDRNKVVTYNRLNGVNAFHLNAGSRAIIICGIPYNDTQKGVDAADISMLKAKYPNTPIIQSVLTVASPPKLDIKVLTPEFGEELIVSKPSWTIPDSTLSLTALEVKNISVKAS